MMNPHDCWTKNLHVGDTVRTNEVPWNKDASRKPVKILKIEHSTYDFEGCHLVVQYPFNVHDGQTLPRDQTFLWEADADLSPSRSSHEVWA